MVSIPELWLPILVSTVLVFVASNLVWMVLPHHKSDARRLPDEAAAVDVLGKQGLKPGLYRFPWSNSMAEMKDPAFVEKLNQGPVALLTVIPAAPSTWVGRSASGPATWSWSALRPPTSTAAVGPGAHYLEVFRVGAPWPS